MTWSAVTYQRRWAVRDETCHGWLLPLEGWPIRNNACTSVQRERTRTNIGLSTGHTRTTPPKLYGRLVGIASTASCRPAWTTGTLSRFGGTYLARRMTSQGLRRSKRMASSTQEVRRRLKSSTTNSALISLPISQGYRPLSLYLPTHHSGSWL